MGMDNNIVGNFQDGLDIFQDLKDRMDGSSGASQASNAANEMAHMKELDAMSEASDQRSQTKRDARTIRENEEMNRANANARWGQSGLAMSGSKQILKDARSSESAEAENDALFSGEQRERDILNQGRREANVHRINNGAAPKRSTLSLGSSIYDYRR